MVYKLSAMLAHPQVLVCKCSRAGVLPPQAVERALELSREMGAVVTCVDDLCELSAMRDAIPRQFSALPSVVVMACNPRAIRSLFDAAQARLDPATAVLVDLRRESPDEALRRAGEAMAHKSRAEVAPVQVADSISGGDWFSWFPVIDFERCNHCMQCLGFCLFGVFGVNESRQIEVAEPEKCKPNCPACARVCPEAAILFPKHKEPFINGEAVPPKPERERQRIDISSVLGGDVYSALRARSAGNDQRFSAERDPESARRERQRRLAMLAQFNDIPPEVLRNLPSADEIAARAEEARAKASAALSADAPVARP